MKWKLSRTKLTHMENMIIHMARMIAKQGISLETAYAVAVACAIADESDRKPTKKT